MSKPMRVIGCAVLCMSLLAWWVSLSQAQENMGRCRIVRTDGTIYVGDVIDEGDAYKVAQKKNIFVRIPKNEVREFVQLAADGGADAAPGDQPAEASGKLSSQELAAILGPSESFALLETYGESSTSALDACTTDEESVAEMQQLADPSRCDVLETDHFVFVYTSERKVAQRLAARLESVYRWNVRFMELMGIPSHRPRHRLEIYFFGKHEEFRAYAAYDIGGAGEGLLGFYMPPTNRSAFFAMEDWPPFQRAHEALGQKGIDGNRRMKVENLIRRLSDHMNLEVVQHEAAHHIHFNIGLFNPRAPTPRWLGEGMAQMFEAPPSPTGGSLGTTNYSRLREFRRIHGADREKFPPGYLSYFLWRMPHGQFTAADYPLGWAICHYLWSKERAAFGKFLLSISEMEDDVEVTPTEKQKMWEDAFGPLKEDWEKKFFKHMNSIPLKTEDLIDFP
jgi:hypothetical protein